MVPLANRSSVIWPDGPFNIGYGRGGGGGPELGEGRQIFAQYKRKMRPGRKGGVGIGGGGFK
jgi:hypothetical protein